MSYITAADLDNAAYITAADVSAMSYITSADFEASELVTSKAINHLQTNKEDVGVCVSYNALSAMSYITADDLPDYSNTYQAKGDYVTPTDLSNAAYITNADVSAMGYITNADVSAMSYATISYVSTYYGRIVTLTQAQYDALQVKDPMTIYIISDAQ